jgi:[protein-PII] uridylyltransferase
MSAGSVTPSGPRLGAVVIAAREQMTAGREKLRRQHDSDSPGVQVCAHFTDLLEQIVRALFQDALAELPAAAQERAASSVALVAHSGFGRREMAPYSDIDVMLLHSSKVSDQIKPLTRRFSQNLYDTGMEVGYTARTPADACRQAMDDATILTSLSESRLIGGEASLFDAFDGQFRRMVRRRWRRLVGKAEEARKGERTQYGETVFLLEPNVKRSRGGLRDLQFIRWVGFVRYGENDFDALAQAGWLTKEEQKKLRSARDFLLWLRNDLHFETGKASDVLERTEQVRLAERRNYPSVAGLLPVEQFMREYFQHTCDVRDIAAHFAAAAQPCSIRAWIEPLLSRRIDGFRVGPATIGAAPDELALLRDDLSEVLRLFEAANRLNRRIDEATWQAIRAAMLARGEPDPNQQLPAAVTAQFLSLLAKPARLGESLRRLHELRVLEQFIPGMSHARGLLQFNAYHRYTVDEHSIRVVEHLTDLTNDRGTPGEVYRSIKDKATLHLAALLHDLGKGNVEDHSEVGARLAVQTAAHLGLAQHAGETLRFLVHKHLRMSHLAQQHDISDDNVVVPFAVEVGSPEILKMLYVLTLADLAAVGPGVLNQWKQELLTDLYHHTAHLLASDSPAAAAGERVRARREEVLSLSRHCDGVAWWETQALALPPSCLFAAPPAQIVEELDKIRKLPRHEALAWGRNLPDRQAVEYTVGTYEDVTPGIFHKLTGALTSKGQQILSADINTLADGLVFDRFYVRDGDFKDPPTEGRRQEVSHALVAALKDTSGKPPTFRKLWQNRDAAAAAVVQNLPTRITVDNTTAERFTILAIFAYDRMGLLYAIARTLFELGLSVSMAKIGTHLDQVLDVFYVADARTGEKVTDEHRLTEIRRRLLEAVAALAVPEQAEATA